MVEDDALFILRCEPSHWPRELGNVHAASRAMGIHASHVYGRRRKARGVLQPRHSAARERR
jgi:hypothetical protein